ncbi:hypothetical protein PTKIN_Ptkin09bG0217600 [Pterospermum kingtungense]
MMIAVDAKMKVLVVDDDEEDVKQLKIRRIVSNRCNWSSVWWAYDLPTGFISLDVGKQLSNYIGKFIDYDVSNNSSFWRNYMRIMVSIDVRIPLKKKKRVSWPGRYSYDVHFKYERLPNFYFVCGLLGHTENFYSKVFDLAEGELKRE